MNSVIQQSLQQISVALNSELNLEADHAWLVPAQAQDLILTLLWRDEERDDLTLSLALGTVDERTPPQLAVDMLATNLALAVHRGPRLSYSPSTHLLILLDTLPCHLDETVALGQAVNNFVTFGAQIREQFCQQGYNLHIDGLVV
ncbi:MAG: type III secretion system chaperone [Kluyvera sp.]|uniref:type III secretion system chaperone n=1 Tax=Kluyvera sp. TaxID=1538228 RepID=UPI003F410A83